MTMLNPALAALLKTAQMATPQGTPTVAQGIAKLALQQEMPQAAPPALPEVAENVQAALPTMERNAQQAQMEQIANMVAQRMSPEASGIAQLPAGGGEYAEGGVVGYNGQTGSDVVNPEVERILKKGPYERTPEENALLRASGVELAQRAPAPKGSGVSLVDKFLTSPFLRAAFTGGAHTVTPSELQGRSDVGALTEKIYRGMGGSQYLPTSDQNAVEPLIAAAFSKPRQDQPIVESRGQELRYPPRPFDVVATKPRPGPGASSTAAAAPAPASAVGAPATGEDPYKYLKELAGRGEYKGDAPTLAEQINLANQARWARGLTGGVGEGLEKLVQDLRAEQARLGTEREKSLKGRPLENLIQSFAAARTGGLGGLGRTYANLQSAQRAEQERFNALQYERKIALAKMDATRDEMREAAAQNDMKGFTQAMDAHRAAQRAYDKTTADAQMNLAQFAGQDRRSAEDRASRERTEALQRSTQLQIAKIQAAARDNPGSREALAVARVQAAINGSKRLQELAKLATFDKNAAAQYEVEEQRLYLRLAPELLIGAGGGGGAASSSRSAADAILKGTK